MSNFWALLGMEIVIVTVSPPLAMRTTGTAARAKITNNKTVNLEPRYCKAANNKHPRMTTKKLAAFEAEPAGTYLTYKLVR